MGKRRGEFFLLRGGGFCYNAKVMAQITIRNVDDNTLAALKRRAAAEGRSLSAVLRERVSALARERFPDEVKSRKSEEEAWAAVERIWEEMKSETPVKERSADIIREGREERWARIDPRMAELEREGR